MEVLKSICAMITACLFVWCAANFVAAAISNAKERWGNIVVATIIEAVSFSIWIPNLNTVFETLKVSQQEIYKYFIVSIVIIVSATVITAIGIAKKYKT